MRLKVVGFYYVGYYLCVKSWYNISVPHSLSLIENEISVSQELEEYGIRFHIFPIIHYICI